MTKVFDALTHGVMGLGTAVNTHALEIALIVWTFAAFFMGIFLGVSA